MANTQATTADEAAEFERVDRAMRAQTTQTVTELRAGGWDNEEQEYDLSTYRGDLEAFEERIGRKATREERADLEAFIRVALGE